jgi:antitoxin (DNA-binding transcriptional repressor) of toxin-antitoxin stability system
MRLKSRTSQQRTYTMRQLNQHTADVIREINEAGKAAAITRHGRFVAIIFPVADTNIEAQMLDKLIETTERSGQLTGESTESGVMGTEELAQQLGVRLTRSYQDKDVEQ